MNTAPLLVYTDGACAGNPGPGGWAWAVENGPCGYGSEEPSTNQRMEVQAVRDALETFLARTGGPIVIVSDSTYVVKCFNDKWWEGWERRGWKNSQKQPVANQDLWKPLVKLVRAHITQVSFRWVKGHSGHPMNDKVDGLAVVACREQSPRTVIGLEPVESLEPAADAETPAAASAATLTATLTERLTATSNDADRSNAPQALSLFD